MLNALPGGTLDATVADSVAANNASSGLLTTEGSRVMAIRFVSANNTVGMKADTRSLLRMSRSTVTGNTFAWIRHIGGTLVSYVDNYADGNGDDGRVGPSSTARK